VKQAAFPESAVSWEVLSVICKTIGLLTQLRWQICISTARPARKSVKFFYLSGSKVFRKLTVLHSTNSYVQLYAKQSRNYLIIQNI